MSTTKSINITSKDFNNIEKVFDTYLKNNPTDLSTLKNNPVYNKSIHRLK